MRVALDEQIFAIQPYGGISRMFAELAQQFSSGDVPDIELLPLSAPIVNRYILQNSELSKRLHARDARNPWTALARYMSRMRLRVDADIVHNTFYLPHGLVPVRGAKRIVTVHDMIPELLPQSRRRLDLLTLKERYVKSADHIICVSEATKQDLIKVYGPPDAPISIIHHGVDPRFHPDVPKAAFLPERYVLHVGHRGYYKDADVYFRAFSRLASHDPHLQLLCVGGDGLSDRESKRLVELGIRHRVSQRYLPDEAMASAYAHALAFVFPSHFEGFGLPALEAMACGTPVVLAAATSLPEVGGDAADYFEPGSDEDLASVLGALLNSPDRQQELRLRGLQRAAQFTWPLAAKRTAEVYRQTLHAG
jgi:glycosyltransferase involved in cell wall biosynthesis